ncbi:MAG: hypothetical protein BroJett018_27120 [Chloroflexota bacterium]|nr:MAG: hypothetical protein BroJett018_27120 [Chloroflexota bacterium]
MPSSKTSYAQDDSTPTPEPVGSVTKDGGGFEMVYVPSGVVEVGIDFDRLKEACSGLLPNDDPTRCAEIFGIEDGAANTYTVELEAFWIDRYEVTIEQYQPCIDYGHCKQIDLSWTPQMVESLHQPQVGVTWFDAMIFCNLRGSRLPTEAEWEYAASGPEKNIYPWGNALHMEYLFLEGVISKRTYEVGSIPENRSWVGAYDMAGNAAEWVEDRWLPRLAVNPATVGSPTDTARTLRGGSWEGRIMMNTTFTRDYERPESVSHHIGFRCVRSTPPSS